MSYQVLARKWRPRVFEQLAGQEHVVRALVNALDHGRLHHAFLFTGTRGVGKTTIARILAKSLNCETGVTSTPCGECSACKEVDEGRFLDLIEVDAASRTKVDDTRELLENVQYAPTRGRFKVYLIDEVHMLSGHSFNALLKTLEEPPPHVKFLLATTEPQKLPVTVLSRCLQFNLKHLTPDLIVDQLGKILEAEGIANDRTSIALLARFANGSMRDALSLLDQAIAYGGGKLVEKEVREMLGTIDQDVIERILNALETESAAELLAVVNDAAEHNTDFDALLQELLLALHRISVVQMDQAMSDQSAPEFERASAHARAMSPEDVQLYYQIGLTGRRDLIYAPDPRTGVEMALLRMLAFRPLEAPREQSGKQSHRDGGRKTAHERAAESPAKQEAADWGEVVAHLKLSGVVRELANNTAVKTFNGNDLVLWLDEQCGQLHNKERETSLRRALGDYYGREINLKIEIAREPGVTPAREKARVRDERQQAAIKAINDDPNVRAFQEQFNARINTGSIRPKV